MQWIDWAILIIIFFSASISLLRGFVKEALSLASWLISFFVAKGFYQDFATFLDGYIDTPSLRFGIAWIGLFFITLGVLGLINYIIGRLVEKVGLSGMDRIMGMAFGVFRGILVSSLVIIGLKTFTQVEKDNWWQQSQLVSHVEVVGNWFYDHVKSSIPEINKKLNTDFPVDLDIK